MTQDTPGSRNSTPVIEEMVIAQLSDDLDAEPGSKLFDLHYREFADSYREGVILVLSILRSRGFLTSQALEAIDKEIGE